MPGRWDFLQEWMDPDRWVRSEPGRFRTRVVLNYEPRPGGRGGGGNNGGGNEEGLIVMVLINRSMFDAKWSPIIEIEGEPDGIFLSGSTEPQQPHPWFASIPLAQLAAFEYLWPSNMENWEGTRAQSYFVERSYQDFRDWKYYGGPRPS